MSKKVLVSLDMNKNEIQNVVMQSLATAPASPKEGQYYYNSADGKAYQYVRTSASGVTPATYTWKPLGGAEITVDSAMSSTSTNPVQNKVINSTLENKVDKREAVKMSSFRANQALRGINIVYDSVDTIDTDSFMIFDATDSDYGVVKLDASVTANGVNPVTGKAIYDYVGGVIAASDAMIFKGTIGTDGTVTALPTTYKTGWTYRVTTAGTYASQDCEEGDLIIALVDRDGTGNLDSDWTVAQTNIDGAITSISGTSPISVTGSGASRAIAHKASGVSAGSYGEGSDKTVAFGDILSIPYISVDSTGHITGAETDTITFPSNVATPEKAGLMSASDKDKLDNTLKLKKAELVIDPSNTSATATLSVTSPKIIAVEAMYYDDSKGDGYEAVIVDWECDGPTFKASIAQAETQFSIWIYVLYI